MMSALAAFRQRRNLVGLSLPEPRTLRGFTDGLAFAIGLTGPMLRIHRTSGRTIVFRISGKLDTDGVKELCHLLDAEPGGGVLILDLTDLVLADRDGVRFLREYETRGRIALRNCPAYVRSWMAGEHGQL